MKTIPNYLLLSIGITAVFLSGCNKESDTTTVDKPINIVFLFTDDQRWDAVGYAGNEIIKTPNLDRLASFSTTFSNAFVTTPICCVSRGSVLTGLYGRSSGVQDFFTPLELETTYPRYLREGGYYTGFIGKWGTLETNKDYFMQAADLFDYWAGSMGQSNYWHERNCNFVLNNGTSEKHEFFCDCPPDSRGISGEGIRVGKANIKDPVHQETYVIPEKVRSFLDQRDPQKPFCLSISFKAPHGPASDFDPKYAADYEGIRMPVAASVTEEEALKQPEFLRNSLNGSGIKKIETAHELDGSLQKSMREYYRLLNGMDFAVGQIVEELEQRGLADNTVIIFYSDNGHFMAEHGFHGKWLMYEESIRVPGFIYDPRNKQHGSTSNEMVLNIDITPTILELAKLDVPSHMQGKSLLPLMKNPDMLFREDFFAEHHFYNTPGPKHIERSEAVRTREWKYICYIDQEGKDAEELFHLTNDPLEMNDLSEESAHQAKLDQLRKRYEEYKTILPPKS